MLFATHRAPELAIQRTSARRHLPALAACSLANKTEQNNFAVLFCSALASSSLADSLPSVFEDPQDPEERNSKRDPLPEDPQDARARGGAE
jgi:hypothetical protein